MRPRRIGPQRFQQAVPSRIGKGTNSFVQLAAQSWKSGASAPRKHTAPNNFLSFRPGRSPARNLLSAAITRTHVGTGALARPCGPGVSGRRGLEGKLGKGTNSFVPSARQNETRASAPEVSFAALTNASPLRTTPPPRKCLAFAAHKCKKERDCEGATAMPWLFRFSRDKCHQ
jgi:hypothetical protein